MWTTTADGSVVDRFDFADLYLAQTMLLGLDDIGIVAVFDDSQAALNYFMQKLERIAGPVSELQLREIMAEFAYLNLHLKYRPSFHSDCDLKNEICTIVGTRPDLDLLPLDLNVRGRLLHHALKDVMPHIRVTGRTQDEIIEGIKAGLFSLLFDEKYEFISQNVAPPKHP
jgi:hypothetical protein